MLRRFAFLSERSSLHRQAQHQALVQGRRVKVRAGTLLVRFLWMTGYLSVVLGALFSTFFFPDLFSILRSQSDSLPPYLLPKVFLPTSSSTL